MPHLFHLVCGSTGAGKTTYAINLADKLGGIRFSIDEWMMTLFGRDVPEAIGFAWMMERVGRCEAQIGRMAVQAATRGLPVILDLGFTQAEHRARMASLARDAGFSAQLHWLESTPETRWARVQARNEDKGATFAMTVSRAMFDFVETLWEPPTAAEMAHMQGVRVG
ncbi:AAA family ATPase [Teichococcus vastitatis]|uniref:ATP-binding protein n=1 Tax=Teichococcus vastitatis TaxID=2307076 RepID=A0ABS9W8T4_9PROT|nr:ATP-binding protein [Pseudoroseomonas vastitatis]MCI0755642.1 ATP-binding protein [Pseudoroseomonas vastitatis]